MQFIAPYQLVSQIQDLQIRKYKCFRRLLIPQLNMPGLQQLYQQRLNTNTHDYELLTWEHHYQALLDQLDGKIQEKQQIIRKRILRYFGQFKLEEDNYFSIRIQGNFQSNFTQLITNEIVLYGVDYLSIQRAKNYFKGFFTEIKRIDDSHFLIKFRNEDQVLKALREKTIQKQPINSPIQITKKTSMGWIKMKPYHQFIFQRKLMARYRTNMDNFEFGSIHKRTSVVHAYSEAKRKFINSLQMYLQSEGARGGKFMRKQYFCRSSEEKKKRTSSSSNQRSRQKNSHKLPKDLMVSCTNCHNLMYVVSKKCAKKLNTTCNDCSRIQVYESPCSARKKQIFQSPLREKMIREEWKKYGSNDKRLKGAFEQELVERTNKKFQEYIKVRDECKSTLKGKKGSKKNEQDMFCDEKLLIQPTNTSNVMNTSSIADFECFLQKLKIGDSSSHEYSRFQVDMN